MRTTNIFLLFIFIIVILYYAKFILLPLSLALFFYLIIKSLTNRFLVSIKNNFKIHLNQLTVMFLIFTITLLCIYFFWIILKFNLNVVKQNSNSYQDNFEKVISFFKSTPLNDLLRNEKIFESLDLMSIFSMFINNLSLFAGNFSFIILFLLFFMFEENFFVKKIKSTVSPLNIKVLNKINYDIFYYFQLKTLTSILTGILTFIILLFLKNDLAPAFGILSFFLNFIPFLGSFLSILLPVLFSAIQFLNIFEPILTLILLTFIQIYVGNVLEPRLMGKTLNISPLVMVIFLSIMGKIWGIAGMFLSVPFLVIILIILSKIKSTKKIAILISEKGEI